jgi:hypothetical protein
MDGVKVVVEKEQGQRAAAFDVRRSFAKRVRVPVLGERSNERKRCGRISDTDDVCDRVDSAARE